jgi:NADH-quinone oxidoreductase subunit C
MTKMLQAELIGDVIRSTYDDAIEDLNECNLWIRQEYIRRVCTLLKESPQLDFQTLTSLTAVDYIGYFELVYHLVSIQRNHSSVLKCRLYGRDAPAVESVTDIWRGADLQEREIWDLMGVSFIGHPNLKRVLTWEGFPGHPLQKSHLGG